MTNPNITSNQAALLERLSKLEICLAKSSDGLLTIYSNSEPAFCYDGYDVKELNNIVSDTLQSYAKTFYDLDIPKVTTQDEPLPEPPVPVEHVKVKSRLRPVFDLAA